jgi:peptidyl-prolyl cis-trans isomerase C
MNQSKKKFLYAALGCALSLAAYQQLTHDALAQAAAASDSKPVAIVNGKPISRQMLEVYAKLQRTAKPGTPADKSTLIQNLVSLQLLTDDAIKKGLDKDPMVISQLDFQRLNILASADLRQLLTSHKFTDEELKKEYDRLVAAQPRKEYKASHILTKTKAEAEDVIKELDKGKSFPELAKEKSIDPSAKQNSGDLGWFPPQQMVKPFSEAIEKMKKGTYTKTPVQSEFGWHVIKLEDERDVQAPPFEQVKPQVEQILQGKMVSDYVTKLKAQAKVEIPSSGEQPAEKPAEKPAAEKPTTGKK